jgi:hypothetical protein
MKQAISQASSGNADRSKSQYIRLLFPMLCCGLLAACGSPHEFESFSHRDPYMKEADFKRDVAECEAEKNKHSSKIQGREFGLKGKDAGFLGCMKLKGWDRNRP